MTFGEKYDVLSDRVHRELSAAETHIRNGDLWQTMVHLDVVIETAEEMRQLLLDVSKTAFERVMKEKAK